MGTVSDLMNYGTPAALANILGNTPQSLTCAAVTTASGAGAIQPGYNIVLLTATTGANSAVLSTAHSVGTPLYVVNLLASTGTASVYCPNVTVATMNGTTNGSVLLTTAAIGLFVQTTGNVWVGGKLSQSHAMALTLLEIVDAVTGELGLVQPASVVGATDLQTLQLYSLVNREGDNLRRTHQWTALQSVFTLAVTAPIVTTGTVVNGSATITGVDFSAGVPVAQLYMVSGDSIPVAARIISVSTAASSVTMDMVGTADAAATEIVFAQDTYAGPTDYDFSINRTSWDRTNRWELLGPDSPQMDQWHRSGIVTVGPRRHFRWVGDTYIAGTIYNYRLWPPPAAVDTPFQIAWEYVSTSWARSAAGVGKSSMTLDTDLPNIDSHAIVLGVKWRFLQAKGFPTAASMQQEYLDYVQQIIARDGGAPTLSMKKRVYPLFITPANVQDGFWPGPTGPNTT